jgi:outer membrane protein OmpA-like peptidoglycan-associated protein
MPNDKLLIEGNCDERGTEEYNRALGERRALAAREALAKAGVSPDRIRTISYGKDKPVDPGHDESAWKAKTAAMISSCCIRRPAFDSNGISKSRPRLTARPFLWLD